MSPSSSAGSTRRRPITGARSSSSRISALAKYACGFASLHQGDWQAGFPLYEARENIPAAPYQPLRYQRWAGEPLREERLVLLAEQGLGDQIQFSRFGPVLAARGIDVTILTSEAMRPLLSTLEGVSIATPADAPAPNGRPLRWLPLMSVTHVLGIRPDTIPANVPYLAAEPARVDAWRRKLGTQGFKVGIIWAPGPARTWFDAQRFIPLGLFAPLASLPDVRLISLQHGAPAGEIGTVAFRDRIEVFDIDADPAAPRFLDTAAVMAQLDLIVTCDTAAAQLAGALARPVFTAVTHVADWRWLGGREDTPWYPNMRVFRQSKPGEWSDVFTRIAAAVEEMAKAASA